MTTPFPDQPPYQPYQSPGVQPTLVPTDDYASWFQRVGAYLVDQLVMLAAMIPSFVGIGLFIAGSDVTMGYDRHGNEVIDDWALNGVAVAGLAVAIIGLFFAIGVAFWNIVFRQGRTGSSIGKSAVGLILVKEMTGKPIGAGTSFIRQLLHVLDSAICNLGYLWPLWDDKRQTLADKCVNTVVIRRP